jgi:glycosyltransferase involved in cell wall biosynthesis
MQAHTGYGRHIRETVQGLRRLGYTVEVMHAVEPIDSSAKGTPQGIKSSRLKSLIPKVLWESIRDIKQLKLNDSFKKRVKEKIHVFRPDFVYERTSYLSDTISVNDDQIPWFLEVNAPFVEQRVKLSGNSLLLFLAERFEKRKYSKATNVFCVSSVLVSFLNSRYKVPMKKLITNHNGVDESEFDVTLRKEESEGVVFGFVGSIMPYHGVELLLEAFEQVVTSHLSAKLLVVGDGFSLPVLKEWSKEKNLSESIEFTGGVSSTKVAEYLGKMDVCILPNTAWYCSPIKLFEYGVMKKFVIAPDLPPVQEIITQNTDGVLVDGLENLVDAMNAYILDRTKYDMMGASFQEKVLNHFTWAKNVERIDAAIKRSKRSA